MIGRARFDVSHRSFLVNERCASFVAFATLRAMSSSLSVLQLLSVALLRVVAGVVDGALLLTRPRLLRWWWATKTAPSAYALSAFEQRLLTSRHCLVDDDLVYGEAFVSSAWWLLKRHGAGVGSVVVDLGCGRGAVLIAARRCGAEARGVDVVEGHLLLQHAGDNGVVVQVGDARAADVGDVSHVWLSWATWSAPVRAALTKRLRSLPGGAIVMGVVHGIDDDDEFEIVATTKAWCSWGRADIVVSRRR